jgi:CRP-like cAMP-binding protein
LAAGLSSAIGIRPTLFATGAAVAAMAVAALVGMRGLEQTDEAAAAAQNIVDATSLFELLSVAVKSGLARELTPVEVGPGAEVITEGEPGDDFFMVETGHYEVSIGGQPRRILGAGDGFGEIALLFDLPRTATIRAQEGGKLWRLDRQSFLGALTGNPDSYQMAREIAARRRVGET